MHLSLLPCIHGVNDRKAEVVGGRLRRQGRLMSWKAGFWLPLDRGTIDGLKRE